ncbi:uncharacterized protein J8A68_001454 [[Candida] subhashii]|uniref:ethanolamine kinase n=1 Tax=[Candida] subhashii TaxID=561895 RepID=A0A8J5QNV1_9ASCO|nr:uncharacterized protein J8A68_001454 [[Candida] subhashii]KAG7664989.1 hypothetical protein J8A68_001454 [[Candida] subhashii]
MTFVHSTYMEGDYSTISNNSTTSGSFTSSLAAYCFINNHELHCIPIISDNINTTTINIERDENDLTPNLSHFKNKNLLYSLNNPSASDVEPDSYSAKLDSSNNNHLSSPSTASSISAAHSGDINSTVRSASPSPSPSPSPIPSESHSSNALYLPKHTVNLSENLTNGFQELKELLIQVFPNWSNKDEISISQLTGGITNMLLSCKYFNSRVLIRVYGHGTNLIIDRNREFVSHLMLNSIDLAPPVYARFKNGMIYGYLDGRSLQPQELTQQNIYPLIAQQLGNLHCRLKFELIDSAVSKIRSLKFTRSNSSTTKKSNNSRKKKYISNVWELLDTWTDIIPTTNPNIIQSFQTHLPNIAVTPDNFRQVIKDEIQWVKHYLEDKVESPIVASHCDLLSGNVIIPDESQHPLPGITGPSPNLPPISENPIKFIDYEYMLPAPRAFDIANHLAEWQGFECDRSRIPDPSMTNPTIVNWVKAYLNDMNASEEQVKQLIEEIRMYYGMPGFYWGIWAVIQSELSTIDFDYAEYSVMRLQEYWDWKLKVTN